VFRLALWHWAVAAQRAQAGGVAEIDGKRALEGCWCVFPAPASIDAPETPWRALVPVF
jgi:hypothetical protein